MFKTKDLKKSFFETLITKLNKLINTTKAFYHQNISKKLNNPLLQAKASWSIMKTFYNEKKSSNSTSFSK